jgi:hypothetical protein
MFKLILAEYRKLKRTLALQMVLIGPALVILLSLMIVLRNSDPVDGSVDPWSRFTGSALGLWTLLMVPLLITLQSSLTGFLEHSNSMWKYLQTLPFKRGEYLIAKFVVNFSLLGLAFITIIILQLLGGFAVLALKLEVGYSAQIPWFEIIVPQFVAFCASGLMVTIHTWISLRFSSIVISLGSGIAAVVTSVIILNSEFGQYFPWSSPGFLAMLSADRADIPEIVNPVGHAFGYVAILIPITAVVMVLAALDFNRQNA